MVDISQSEMDVLIAKQAVHDTIMYTCRAVDRGDLAMFRSAYHPDATEDHGYYKGAVADFVPSSFTHRDRWVFHTHTICNVLVEVEGDVAFSEALFMFYYRLEDKGDLKDWTVCGRYLDRFERRNGAWKIAHRTVVLDWNRADPVLETADPQGMTRGCRSLDDPIFHPKDSVIWGGRSGTN